MQKLKVAIIYGGRSGEHEVSCISAAAVLQNLDRNLFEPIPVAIDKNGRWLIDQEPNVLLADKSSLQINFKTAQELPLVQPASNALANLAKHTGKLFDVAFPIIHGVLGEDGTLQGLLELLNVPYVGANVLSSALGMDKAVSKKLVSSAGIPVVPFMVIGAGEWQLDTKAVTKKILSQFNLPIFVKPCNTGSSVGIERVRDESRLAAAIDNALLYDQKVVIENALDVRDVELSVLENRTYGAAPRVSVAGEVVLAPKHEFYTYTAKYLDPDSLVLDIPAKISDPQLKNLQTMAQQIFTVLECEGMARVDLFIERKTDQIFFNEINTLPGFTPYSMYPKLWEASGLKYKDLLTEVIQLAVSRFERRQRFKYDWR
jgi:D-alanine-D-alanine ligase